MKKYKFIKSIVAACLAVFVLLTGNAVQALAATVPYVCYNYDYRENIVYTPAAYEPLKAVTTDSMMYEGELVGAMKEPQDICKTPDGSKILVADTGNNRIIVFNEKLDTVLYIISTYNDGKKDQKFKTPTGVTVSSRNLIYICESKAKKITVLDENYEFVKYIDNPQSEILDESFVFNPLKVSVDYAERVYCIAQGQYEGIMVFDTNGEFTGFFGTIEVKISTWEKFWRRIATKEEKSNQKLFIPTEFTGMDIDDDGFVYASNIDSEGTQGVRRLNPRGEDVIKKGENGNLGGDLSINGTGDYAGASQFVDVVYRGSGIYSCLDRKRGRIFTYDHEGNLLYVFGGLGTQEGTFQMPVAIEAIGENIVVVDKNRNSISIFRETEYGKLINDAISLRYSGDETQAVSIWQRVLEINENNELANTGIGKAYLTAGDYKMAMRYLRLGMNRKYYSIAYRRYRNGILADNLGYVLTGILVLIIAIIALKEYKKRKKTKKKGVRKHA